MLAGLCFAVFAAALLTTPALSVRNVRIDGMQADQLLSPAELDQTRAAAALPAQTNWIVAPTGRLQGKLSALPWISSASVSRRLPLAITASVSVRTPAYALVSPFGSYEMDAQDVPIRPLRRSMISRLKPVYSAVISAPTPGVRVESDTVSVSGLILRKTQADGVLRIAGIEIDQTPNIWLNMDNGIKVKIGHCDAIDAKLAMLKRLLAGERSAQFQEINVSSPENPAGIPKRTSALHTRIAYAAAPDSDTHHAGSVEPGIPAGNAADRQ